MAFFTSSSVGVLLSVLTSFVAAVGWRVHLTRGGSVFHTSASPSIDLLIFVCNSDCD